MLQTENMAIKSYSFVNSELSEPSLMLRRLYQKSRIFIGQEHMFNFDITSSLFFLWDVLVICLMFVLKLVITAFTSLYFWTLWANWLSFFASWKNVWSTTAKMTENNLASSWSSGTRWAKCRATFAIELGSCVKSWAAKKSKITKLQILTPMQIIFNLHE